MLANDVFPGMKNTVECRVRDARELRRLGFYRELRKRGFRLGIDNVNDPRFRDVLGDPKWDAAVRLVTRSSNIRVYMGRNNWQNLLMFGDVTANATGYTGGTGTATSNATATVLTNTSASFPTSTPGSVNGSLQGHVVYCPATSVYGVIVSNTSDALTVDQWTSMTSPTGGTGTAPSSGAAYAIVPGAGIGCWIAISSNNATPNENDVPRTADGLFGNGSTTGAATEYTTNGLQRQFVQPTFPTPGNVQLATTFTYSGSTVGQNVYTVLLFNAKASPGNLLILESSLTPAVATFNASGDNMSLIWSINLGT